MNLVQLAMTTGLLALWSIVLLVRDRRVLPAVMPARIKFTHVLPAILQVVLFTYWAIYWEGVIDHLPVIAVQLVVAYALDYLLAWTLQRSYTPSFGPVPIVLSMNLFVWFPADQFLLGALVIAIAFWSKAMLVSGGRHVFNPSVLGIAIVGILCIVLPRWFRYQDMSHDFDRPPHMAQVILLLALIPQIRLRIAPVAVGASVAMLGVMLTVYVLTGYQYHSGPSPWWPPWLLAITLLAGDPATIPSGSVSRLLFGLFLGTAYYVTSRALSYSIDTDFFSKIIPIPLANLLVPSFERAGTRLSARWPVLHRASANRAYVAVWVSLSLLMGNVFR